MPCRGAGVQTEERERREFLERFKAPCPMPVAEPTPAFLRLTAAIGARVCPLPFALPRGKPSRASLSECFPSGSLCFPPAERLHSLP